MPDDKNESSGFKVVDKRSFAEDGTPRASTPEPAEKPPMHTAPESQSTILDEPDSAEFGEEAPSGFFTLVSYLSTTAMFQLGLLPGPGGERIPVDLMNARMTIDLLDVLKEKTEGNLTSDETRMLDEVLYELRMNFVAVQKQATQPAK